MQMAVEMVRRDQLLQGDIDERGERAIFAPHHGRAFSFHPDKWRLPTSRYRTTQERVFQHAGTFVRQVAAGGTALVVRCSPRLLHHICRFGGAEPTDEL